MSSPWFPRLTDMRLCVQKLRDSTVKRLVSALGNLNMHAFDEEISGVLDARSVLTGQFMLLRMMCVPRTQYFRTHSWTTLSILHCFVACVSLIAAYQSDYTDSQAIVYAIVALPDKWRGHIRPRTVRREVMQVLQEFDFVVLPHEVGTPAQQQALARDDETWDMDPAGAAFDRDTGCSGRHTDTRAMSLQLYDMLSLPRNADVTDCALLRRMIVDTLRTRANVLRALHSLQAVHTIRLDIPPAPVICDSPSLSYSPSATVASSPPRTQPSSPLRLPAPLWSMQAPERPSPPCRDATPPSRKPGLPPERPTPKPSEPPRQKHRPNTMPSSALPLLPADWCDSPWAQVSIPTLTSLSGPSTTAFCGM